MNTEINKVCTSTGAVDHYTCSPDVRDGLTFCGRKNAGKGTGGRMCKSCEKMLPGVLEFQAKLDAQAEQTPATEPTATPCPGPRGECDGTLEEHNGRVQCFSCGYTPKGQAQRIPTPVVTEPTGVPTAIIADHADGRTVECAYVPNGNPARVAELIADFAKNTYAWSNVRAVAAARVGLSSTVEPAPEPTPVPVEPEFPATSNVFVGSGPFGEVTMFADSTATVNEWLRGGRVHKHTARQVPTMAAVCPCDRYTAPESTPAVNAPQNPAPGPSRAIPAGYVDQLAVNGHTMTYRITGRDPETGRHTVSQWDAQHSNNCRCMGDPDFGY